MSWTALPERAYLVRHASRKGFSRQHIHAWPRAPKLSHTAGRTGAYGPLDTGVPSVPMTDGREVKDAPDIRNPEPSLARLGGARPAARRVFP
jgi:hypothetical protein